MMFDWSDLLLLVLPDKVVWTLLAVFGVVVIALLLWAYLG
jgi:hypothetical protein